jgi:hypothetical protein
MMKLLAYGMTDAEALETDLDGIIWAGFGVLAGVLTVARISQLTIQWFTRPRG